MWHKEWWGWVGSDIPSEARKWTMTMTMKNVLFDHKYMYVHNILYFRKCKYLILLLYRVHGQERKIEISSR